MTTIHKYRVPVPRFNECLIEMPRHAKAIHVAAQGDEIMLWAEVDTEEPMAPRRYHVFGTGHRLTANAMNGRYIGTAHLSGLGLVFHVYEGFV